jgi:hypothetical protein
VLRPLTPRSAGAPQRVTGGDSPTPSTIRGRPSPSSGRGPGRQRPASPRRLSACHDSTRQSKARRTKAPRVPTPLQCRTAPAARPHYSTSPGQQHGPSPACEITFHLSSPLLLLPPRGCHLAANQPATDWNRTVEPSLAAAAAMDGASWPARWPPPPLPSQVHGPPTRASFGGDFGGSVGAGAECGGFWRFFSFGSRNPRRSRDSGAWFCGSSRSRMMCARFGGLERC